MNDSYFIEKIAQIPFYQNLNNLIIGDKINPDIIIDKAAIINSFPNGWISQNIKDAFISGEYETTFTSGTTSERMQIIRPKNWWLTEYSRTANYNKLLKKREEEKWKKAILTTAICSNTSCYLELPAYEDRIINNTLYLNIHPNPNQWNKLDVQRICNEITDFQPKYIDVDPVYLSILFDKIEFYDISFEYKPIFITLSYEYCTKILRNYIKSQLDIPYVSLYGSTEIGYILCECEQGNMHLCDDSIKVQLIPFKDRKDLFELIVSSYRNPYMPFVNYRTGDIVKAIKNNRKCKCSINSSIDLIWIMGREKDSIIINNVVMTYGDLDEIIYSISSSLDIFLYQLVSKDDNNLYFRYTTFSKKELNRYGKNEIVEHLELYFRTSLTIIFVFEQSIRPESSGKFSILKNERYEK